MGGGGGCKQTYLHVRLLELSCFSQKTSIVTFSVDIFHFYVYHFTYAGIFFNVQPDKLPVVPRHIDRHTCIVQFATNTTNPDIMFLYTVVDTDRYTVESDQCRWRHDSRDLTGTHLLNL